MTEYVNSFIDTVQGAKTTFVKTFVPDTKVAKTLQSFIDAQTTFTKQVVATTSDIAGYTQQQMKTFDASKLFATAK
jgi:hypothetical protein